MRNSYFKTEKGDLKSVGKSVFEVLLQRNPAAAQQILDCGINTNSQVLFIKRYNLIHDEFITIKGTQFSNSFCPLSPSKRPIIQLNK